MTARVAVRALVIALVTAAGSSRAEAQPPGKWPPDSLVNVQVIPKTTQPVQVWGMMRNIAGALVFRAPSVTSEATALRSSGSTSRPTKSETSGLLAR